jgi:hypothetical protein
MGEGEVMTLLEELTSEATIRDENQGWVRETVSGLPEVQNPELLAPFAKAYMGEKSLTVKDTKTRKIVGDEVSPGELSRLYMKRIMADGDDLLSKKVPWRRDALQFLDRRPAYYFAGQCAGPFILVDITACYATLYSRLTLDLTYRPECNPPLLGIGRGAFPRADEWLTTKAPRNALWGNLLRPRIREWRHGEPIDDALPNRFFAPDLTGIVLDACHAIACHARENGALSWAVDGGVFRPEEGRVFIEWLRSSFGLEADVRAEGPGWLFGATSYSIGPTTTEDVKKGRAREWPETNHLRRISKKQCSWLGNVFKERS